MSETTPRYTINRYKAVILLKEVRQRAKLVIDILSELENVGAYEAYTDQILEIEHIIARLKLNEKS